MQTLGVLEEIADLRTVWLDEARDFTPWLAQDDNLDILADAVGLDITLEATETPVGEFRVDISAYETNTARRIVIENQLGDTNHDHLGKLITYASGKSADIVIWVVKRARNEHRAAIAWLNDHTDEDVGFFLCEVKLYHIGNSAPAVKFEVIERPNDWSKEIRHDRSWNATEHQRYDFWVEFQDYAFQNDRFAENFKPKKPSARQWMDYTIACPACHIGVEQVQTQNKLCVALIIRDDKALYHTLLDHKGAIESDAGLSFDWRELPDKKASFIVIEKEVTFDDRQQWSAHFDWLIDVMLRMKMTFRKYI